MAENRHASTRLRPIIHEYIKDLVKVGAYGKGTAGVIRRFVENGIMTALQAGVINKRDVRDHDEKLDEGDDEDDE